MFVDANNKIRQCHSLNAMVRAYWVHLHGCSCKGDEIKSKMKKDKIYM